MNIINNDVKVFNLERSIVMQSVMLQNNILAPADVINKRVQILEKWIEKYPSVEINTDLAMVLNNNHLDKRYLSGILVNCYVMISNNQRYILDDIGEVIIDIAVDDNKYDPNIFIDSCNDKENKYYEFYKTAYEVLLQKKSDTKNEGTGCPMVSLVISYNKCGEPLSYKTVLTDKANTLLTEGEKYLYENEVKNLVGSSLVNSYKVYGKINTNYYDLLVKYDKYIEETSKLNLWERDIAKVEFINWVEQLPIFTLLTKNYTDEECK